MNVIASHYDTREYIYPITRNGLNIKLECKAMGECSVYIVYWNRFKKVNQKQQLENYSFKESSHYFSVNLFFAEPVKYLNYYFVIILQEKIYYFSPYGVTEYEPTKHFEYQCTNENDIFTIPQWAKGSVGYQIFPERFLNGNPENDPADIEKWSDGLPNRTNFFGGDLRGIINKCNYIKELGVDIIYLTPIFYSPSNHKYDTIDYFKIDPSFGDIDDLKELVLLYHNSNIRVILDGVFNHIGYYSYQFQDVIYKGKASKFWDWFYIDGDSVDTSTVNYECVGYYKWMPKLKYSNPKVREYFISVGEYWIRETGIDGWRLDVADELDFTFLQEFRRKIKSIDQNLLLIGETWKNGKDLLRGDQMDTIMNYRFRDAVYDYFAKGSINKDLFMERIDRILFDYPIVVHNILYNPLDSHDTDRFLTSCNGDLTKFKLAVIFQMTFPGISFIYYGDEIGMEGETDPDCRGPMAWNYINKEILQFYKQIIKIRKNSKALRYGTFKHLTTESEVYSFAREYEDETAIVLINNNVKLCSLQLDLNKFGLEKFYEVELTAYDFEILILVKGEVVSLKKTEIAGYSRI